MTNTILDTQLYTSVQLLLRLTAANTDFIDSYDLHRELIFFRVTQRPPTFLAPQTG